MKSRKYKCSYLSPLWGKCRGIDERGANKVSLVWPLLPRLTALLPPQGREMNNGFTLIELLVVVLIIGILAALPQYNKAVFKSRVAAQLALLDAIYPAVESCYLGKNDIYACDIDNLEVSATCSGGLYSDGCFIGTRLYTVDEKEVPVSMTLNGNNLEAGEPGDVIFVKSRYGVACLADAPPANVAALLEECRKAGFTKTCPVVLDGYEDMMLCQ